jgi:rare lipoprotein A (peptidoglycan hydrolase)
MIFLLLLFFLISTNPIQARFTKCDDENYQRPKIEEVFLEFVQGEEMTTEKFLQEMCLRPQSNEFSSQASFYGSKFQGRKTASAEPYDVALYTAAHKNLPFGSFVLVKNPNNGKEVIVRINDRGPFVSGRDLDLSDAAAKELDILRLGVAPINYIVLENQLSESVSKDSRQDSDENRSEKQKKKEEKKKSKKEKKDLEKNTIDDKGDTPKI